MKLRVLGCSGGIGGRHLRTTSLLVDQDILLDAGTGVGDLSLNELMLIDHVFLTHSHLDHIAALPLLVDTVGGMREKPLTIHATDATLAIIREHIFNWKIWPDFTAIPDTRRPFMQYSSLRIGQVVELGSRRITPIPANHTVPAVGYHLDSGNGNLIFSGDTSVNDALWQVANRLPNLRFLIIETAFCNKEKNLALASKHLCPSMLAEELAKFTGRAEIYVTHLKPGEIEMTMQEIDECAGKYSPKMLQNNQIFEF